MLLSSGIGSKVATLCQVEHSCMPRCGSCVGCHSDWAGESSSSRLVWQVTEAAFDSSKRGVLEVENVSWSLVFQLGHNSTRCGTASEGGFDAHVCLRDKRTASASWRWCHRAGADGPGATATVDVLSPQRGHPCAQRFVDLVAWVRSLWQCEYAQPFVVVWWVYLFGEGNLAEVSLGCGEQW